MFQHFWACRPKNVGTHGRHSSFLEGDDRYEHRILRSAKNRFGATNEVGIFHMNEDGLNEVSNPSEMFLSERSRNIPGTCIYPSLEGTRPILIEVQALVSTANFGTRSKICGRHKCLNFN